METPFQPPELAVEDGVIVGPEGAHNADALFQAQQAAVGLHALNAWGDVGSACAHADDQTAPRELVKAGELLGELDGVMARHNEHGHADARVGGERGGGGEAHQRLQGVCAPELLFLRPQRVVSEGVGIADHLPHQRLVDGAAGEDLGDGEADAGFVCDGHRRCLLPG